MKSPMVENADYNSKAEKEKYTDLKICQSAAGYYVGTQYWDDELKFWDAGSRDSGYFATKEEAEAYLKMVTESKNPQEYLRDQP